MSIESEKDLIALKKIGRIVANCLQIMGKALEPGMTTRELDEIGRKYLERHGAQSAPRLTYNFPGTTCISINEQAAHGIPGDRILMPSDLVNIDVAAELGGYFADTGGSFVIPPGSSVKRNLCTATMHALELAINEARAGHRLNRIGRAIANHASENHLTVIQNIGSHGVGRALHEEPGFIPGYYDPKDKRVLKENQVIKVINK